jgi:hypothetical protein
MPTLKKGFNLSAVLNLIVNKLILVWILALLLLIIIIFVPLPAIFENTNSTSTSSSNLTVGLIGNGVFTIQNSSINLEAVPTVNYSLNNYNIIVVDDMKDCGLALRFDLANWVRNGGKLIVIGDACTQVPNDPTSIGWNVGVNSLGSVMPVIFGGVTTSFNSSQSYASVENGSFEIIDYSSFAFKNFSNSNFSGNVTAVYPSFDGKVLGSITFENNSENQSFYAVVKSSKYNIFYLSFEPSLEEVIFNNIIQGFTG